MGKRNILIEERTMACGKGQCSCKPPSDVLLPGEDSSMVSIQTKVSKVRRHLMCTNVLTKDTRDMLIDIENSLAKYR